MRKIILVAGLVLVTLTVLGQVALRQAVTTGNVTVGSVANGTAVANTNSDSVGPSFIGAGSGNFISADSTWSAILGGELNTITNSFESFIGTVDGAAAGWGGYLNGGIFNSGNSIIMSGQQNSILDNSPYSAIIGGQTGVIGGTSDGSFIGTGDHLEIGITNATGTWTVGPLGFIGGGSTGASRDARNKYSVIIGGENNIIIGGDVTHQRPYSMILGGFGNTIDGGYEGCFGWWLSNSVPGNILIGMTNKCLTVSSNGNVTVASVGVLSTPTINVSGSGGISLQTNSTAPNNTTTIRVWVSVTNGGVVFKMPLYQ